MSFIEEMSDAPVSITGEMWMCADSAGPLKIGAGRGLKNFITIEKDCFCAYSSRSEQSKQIKQIAFRSMKRVAWFTHHPKPSWRELAASTTAATLRRGTRKDPSTATYYYLVLEFLRDNTIPGTMSLGKRERIVLCTDDQQDFSMWRKFAELYECPPVHEGFVKGRDKKALRAHANADGARDHDDTTSSDDDGYERPGLGGGSAVARRSLDLWKNRCVALLNDFAHLSNPSLQVQNADVFDTPAGCGGLDWDAHVESVLHAIEEDMRPAMKVIPANSTRGAAAGPSSLLSSPSIAPSSIHPCAVTKGTMEIDVDEMQSQASNLQVELEQFQVFAAEVGALVEGRELKTTKILPDTLHAYVERLRKMPTPAEPADSVTKQQVDKAAASASAAAADLAKLESACVNAVRSFTEKVHTSALSLSQEWNREKAEQQEQAALPQRVETIVAVLIDELTRATADVSSLKASLAASIAPTTVSPATSVPGELSELRSLLNRKELEVETLQQQHFDASRHIKQLSRKLEELVFAYSDVAHDLLRSQYREYASLRNLFLRALRGEVPLDNSTAAEASLGASGSLGGMSESRFSGLLSASSSGAQKLLISAAHLEAIQALEQERIAARERQRELEEVMKELEALRQERDEEIANLKCNFLAAGEAWEKDVAVLQAKLSALQSAIPRGALLLPASSLAANTAVKAGIAQKLQSTQSHTPTAPADGLESTESVTPVFAEDHTALHKLTTLLTVAPKETGLEAAVVTQRLRAFYDWALETVVPLSTTCVSDGSVLEMITNVVHAYHALLQQTSTIYTAAKSGTDGTHVDVLQLMRNEHEQFRKLWGILEEHLLIHEAESSVHDSGHQPSSERAALSFSSLPTMDELDQLPFFIDTLCTNAALYSKLKMRSGGVPIATYIQDLEKKSAHLEQQLQHKEQEEKSLSELIAKFHDYKQNTSPLTSTTNSALAALGVEAPASESAAEVIARAAADAAERERALRAEVAAAEERVEAVRRQLEADRDERLRDAQERLAETAAAREELSDGVAGALAALGVEAPASESAAEVIARAAADAAERERALRAEVAAAEERVEAVRRQLEADRDERLRDAQERLAETAAAREELSDGVAGALAALGVEAPASESAAEVIARAAADAAERERALRAEVAAAEERVEAVRRQLEADRDERLRDAQERLAETAAAREELSDGVAGALAALGVEAPASESAAEVIARAAADAAERERALRAEVAAAEERVEAVRRQLEADRDERLRDAQERLAETAAAREELSDGVAGALTALGVEAPASESAAEVIARAAADAAERERALRAEVAAAEERVEAVRRQLEADRDERLRDAQERLAETAAAREELSDGIAGALAALGVEAPASESAAEVIARAAADAAERERALRAEVAAAEERVEAVRRQLEADRDEKLRELFSKCRNYVLDMGLMEVVAEEADARVGCVIGGLNLLPYVGTVFLCTAKVVEMSGMLGCDVEELVGRVRGLLLELNTLRGSLRGAQEKELWYEDPRVRVPLIKLSDFVRKRDDSEDCDHRDYASVAFLAETLRSSFETLQCLDANAVALRESLSSMTALVKECGAALNESVVTLQMALPRAAFLDDASPSQSQPTLPVEWGLRVACRRLAATVSEAVHWQGELMNIVMATFRSLVALSGGTGMHGAPVSDGDTPSFVEYSQLPRLAAQACSEVLQSRRFTSFADELADVTQQRNDLTSMVGVCCRSLRSTISVTTPGRVGSLSAAATSPTCDEARWTLRDITDLTSDILHHYAQSMEHTLAVLTPLANIAADPVATSSSFEMLAAVTENVRVRIEQMERGQLQHLHVRKCDEEGSAQARGLMHDQLLTLSEVSETGELVLRSEQDEHAAPLADVALQQQRWDAVAELFSRFAEDVDATVSAQHGSESQNAEKAELLPLVRQAISLSASAKPQEALQGRLSDILDACKRRASEHHSTEATVSRLSLHREELRAPVTTSEQSLEKIQAPMNECHKPIATMEAAPAALGQSATQMQLVAALAHAEALDFGVREGAASESGVRAPTGDGERVEEMYLVHSRVDAMQDCLNDAEERGSSQVMDAGGLFEAAGQARSLEDLMHVVASYSLEYQTKSLESKESRLRSEIVQDWAVKVVPLAAELRVLRAIVEGVDRPLPGTALTDLSAHGSSVCRELTEAERLLGAAVSAPCTEEATCEALLGATDQACHLLLGAPPERALGTGTPHGVASSAARCPTVTAADAVSTTDVGCRTAPNKLSDAVYAMIEERGDRTAANGTLFTGEEWYCSVARVTQTLCSALSSAGVVVSVPGDHSLMAGHPYCASPESQASILDSLESAAEHVSKYTTDTTRLFEDLRESLQDSLSSTESCLPTLVAAVVEEVSSLRAASQLAAEAQQHRHHELEALRTLLQEASAVFPDTSPFLSTQSPNFMEKCMAYAEECARLTALESELSSALCANVAQRLSWEDASLSLGDLVAELQRDRVELREVAVPQLQGLVCALSVEVLVAEERAARAIMVGEEATSRLDAVCNPQLRELGFLVEKVLARAAKAEAQCAQKTAQHCSLLTAHESLVTTASGLVSVQEDCRRVLLESEGDASCAAVPTCFPPETLHILEQEAVLVPRLVQAHGRLTATCAALRSDLDSAKAAYEQALSDGRADLDIARGRSTEVEAQLEHVLDAIEALGSLLCPNEEVSLRDASCLPCLLEASRQLARTAAEDAAARCRLEKDVCDAAAAFAELQRQCAAAAGNVEALQETVRRYERKETDEIATLKASAEAAAEAYAGIVTALCLSAELVPSAGSAAAAVSEEQWVAVVEAVQATVEEGWRQTSDAAEVRGEMTILQSRMVEVKAAVLGAEAREGNLLQRLNALMMSSGPLKEAVTAVMASHECRLESLEDVPLAMHAAVQLVERQQGNINQLIACCRDLRSDVESLNGRLCGAVGECDMARESLASLEETHGMLQRRMAQLERHVRDTISTVDRRAAAVLGEAESRRLDKDTPADCLDGIAYLADALACRAEECDAAKAQLIAWKTEARDREEAKVRATTTLSTLWQAFRRALLPQLVDESEDPGDCGEAAVTSADGVEFFASEAEVRRAAQMIVDTAERLRRTRGDLQAVYSTLRDHFGGDAATAVNGVTTTPHAPARALNKSGVTSLRFDDTVTATLHLVNTVVNAKCTSVKDFIDHVVSDVLRDTSVSARVSFAALRSGAFAEWLHGLLTSLRTLRESSDQHRDRARRLPAFMDALVEAIHSHGGRVDVTSSDATGALTIADARMPYRHDPTTTLEDWQAREQRAIVHGLQALLNQQEERVRALTAEWQYVTTQYHQLSQEQVAAEETIVELRRRVQFKVQEDYKLEESLRELDSHLDQQARELSMRYFADQDAIVRRFTLLRNQIHAAMRLPTRRSASAMPPRTPGRDTSTPRS
ncbi:conserved hypothetical protein [Leishmania mexicana MHOM/GT/2001/U1103]|uniref:Uncharacterized protein n=1 Tax=Leishmania mexicana (strain MHOM/GT/2001/U1103) TaxID=929439 RepID=E9ATV9_LEIMU|nr:conserved hypothetical protein [Leishmania mexicana MHOM/GT/2001/U1103]CBZ26384.1 conserved hypothetical protein [Leishmania mexicana MHOM/GT/2001/U1103]